MAKFACPHCGKNEDIEETYLAWVAQAGTLGPDGELIASSPPVILDSPDHPRTYYSCYSCNKEFKEPKEVEGE